MSTIYKQFAQSAEKHLRRPITSWKERGKWQSRDYGEMLSQVGVLADWLREAKVAPGDRVAIMSENRPEWLAVDLAVNKIGAVSVPIHAASGRKLIQYIIEDSDSMLVFCGRQYLEEISECRLARPEIKIIVFGEDAFSVCGEGVFCFSEIVKNKSSIANNNCADDSEALASIIYTSGTTGQPKGVMLTNRNFLANINGVKSVIEITEADVFLSFLPLSHVLERTAGSYVPVMSGASIAYAENIAKLSENIREVKPTILVSVPKIFERIYEKIFKNLKTKSPVARKLFYWAIKNGFGANRTKLADYLVYRKIRQAFGGRLRLAVTGGASINERILRFFRRIGLTVIEGYGLTETSPIVAVNRQGRERIGTVGEILPGVEARVDKDKEIMVRGDIVMAGYWRNDSARSEAIDSEGWFHTGDLGYIDNDGYLSIIGRKKEIIVTSNGKNIPPEKVEALLNLSPYISQCVVVGHHCPHLAALIVPDAEEFQNNGGSSAEAVIRKEIEKINQELEKHEQVFIFKILDKPFTVEAEELTPTLKIRRSVIEARHRTMINEMYNSASKKS